MNRHASAHVLRLNTPVLYTAVLHIYAATRAPVSELFFEEVPGGSIELLRVGKNKKQNMRTPEQTNGWLLYRSYTILTSCCFNSAKGTERHKARATKQNG